ncbi:hypothetical protein K9U40_12020, partial [Xanthobacter autotrophicus]|nr:hypothetical protein [Xanthobacter autotrophicus]
MPREVHQIGRVLAIVDGELRIEADLAGIVPQDARADPVKGVRWSRFGGQIGGFAKLGSGVRYAAMSMPSQAVWTSSGVLPPRA